MTARASTAPFFQQEPVALVRLSTPTHRGLLFQEPDMDSGSVEMPSSRESADATPNDENLIGCCLHTDLPGWPRRLSGSVTLSAVGFSEPQAPARGFVD